MKSKPVRSHLAFYYYLCNTTKTTPHMENKKKILVVDDEETLCEALRYNLQADGYEVDTAYSAEEALTLDLTRYDLYLLDIMMGEISGTQLARILKSSPATSSKPVIFCTAKDTEDDMISGLDLGADDYITKPYSIRSVTARIRAVLRRAAPQPLTLNYNVDDNIAYRGLSVIPSKKMCIVDGEEVKLPRKEFEILQKLMSHRGQIFTREEIIREIWPDEVVVLDRVVDVNITRIRHKISEYGKNIVSRSGYGYGFME